MGGEEGVAPRASRDTSASLLLIQKYICISLFTDNRYEYMYIFFLVYFHSDLHKGRVGRNNGSRGLMTSGNWFRAISETRALRRIRNRAGTGH